MTMTHNRKNLKRLTVLGLAFLFSQQAMIGTVTNQTAARTTTPEVSAIVNDIQNIAATQQSTAEQPATENWMSFGFLF